jgi:hemerythrin superfamily protein
MKKTSARKASTGKSTAGTAASKKSTSKRTNASKASASRSAPAKRAASASRSRTSSRSTPASRSGGLSTRAPNAIALLKADHATVRELLTRLEETTARGTKTREELLARIRREIEVHTTLEEEVFYPAFKAAGERGDDDKLYFEALEEHRAAGELVLPDLLSTDPSSECFGGRAKVLKELIEHHAKEEEREMFPRARELLSAQELLSLGERMSARKQELLAQPAPPKSIAGRVLSAVASVIAPEANRGDGEDGEAEGSRSGARKQPGDGSGAARSGR